MEYEVTDYSRPLYGRARILRLHPLPIDECIGIHPRLTDLDQLKLYMTIGGVPLYNVAARQDSYRGCVEDLLLSPYAVFANEGEDMVRRELSPSDEYIRILDAMRGRRNSISDISSRSGIDRNKCSSHLRNMESLGMVSELHPMWGAPKKPRYYAISDSMMAFFFLVKRNDTFYGASPSEKFASLDRLISTMRGHNFEIFCRQLLCRSYAVREIGSWWGSCPERDRDGYPVEDGEGRIMTGIRDIDIAAEVMIDGNLVNLAVECKFVNKPVGFDALNELDSAISCLGVRKYTRKMMISPSGFTEDLISYASENGILLVDLDMILGKSPMPVLRSALINESGGPGSCRLPRRYRSKEILLPRGLNICNRDLSLSSNHHGVTWTSNASRTSWRS